MKTRLLAACLIVAASTAFGMGYIRSWQSNHVYAPPPVVTNTPPSPPQPPVVTNTPAPPPVPVGGPTLVKVWAKSHQVIGFTVTGLEGWPSKTEGGKTIIGIMRCNGKKFDFVSEANKGGGKVVHNLYGAEYGQDIKKGQTVMIDICDLNKKKATNPLPFVWPWEPTGR